VITADASRKAAVNLDFSFDTEEVDDPKDKTKKIKKNLVIEVRLEFEGGERDDVATKAANSGKACFDTTSLPWKVTDSCTIELHFQSLTPGQVITIKAYRMEGKNKVYHPPISIEVR
jgi:hypothetical protein